MMLRKKFGSNNLFHSSAGFVLFSAGSTSVATLRYSLDNQAVQASTSFPASRYGPVAAGNATYGLYSSGNFTANCTKFTFVTAAVTSATSLNAAIANASAVAGNGNLAVFTRTIVNGSNGSIVYTYAGETVAAGNNFAVLMERSVSTCNATTGLYVLNSGVRTNKCLFASLVIAEGGSLTASQSASNTGNHTGNGVIGLLTRTNSQVITSYTFSSDTCADIANLPGNRGGTGMAGTTDIGVFGMANAAGCLYSYSNGGLTTVSALTGAGGGATCSNPFGVNVPVT